MRRQAGFTLLELMVVVVIIGIITSFAVLSIGNRALEDRLEVEAQRLDRLFRLASEEAEIQGIELGLRLTREEYQFLVLGPDGKWIPYDGDPILRSREIQEPFTFELRVEDRMVPPAVDGKDKDKPLEPQVMVLSSGEVTPFSLAVHAPGVDSFWRIEADALGRFTLARQTPKS